MAELLPAGSIVVLEKNPKLMYMIAGYYPETGNEIMDYCAVRYPAGLGDTMQLELFNGDQIAGVKFVGYQNEKSEKMLERIPEFMQTTGELIAEADRIKNQIESLTGDGADDVEGNRSISIEME